MSTSFFESDGKTRKNVSENDPLPISIRESTAVSNDNEMIKSLLEELLRHQQITNEYLALMLGDRIHDNAD